MRLSDEYHENLPSENVQLSLENIGMFVGNKGFWQYKGYFSWCDCLRFIREFPSVVITRELTMLLQLTHNKSICLPTGLGHNSLFGFLVPSLSTVRRHFFLYSQVKSCNIKCQKGKRTFLYHNYPINVCP